MALIPILLQLAVSLPLLYISHLLWLYLRSPLKHIPGPFWAKFTNIWRFWNILGGQSQRTHQQLHDRYGPAVRLGPNFVSLSDPSLIRVIYDTRGTYVKVSACQHVFLHSQLPLIASGAEVERFLCLQ